MRLRNYFQHTFFSRRKLELFGGVFLVTFMVIASLGIIFPQIRNSMHRSAGLLGVSATYDFAQDVLSAAPFSDVPVSDPYAKSIAYLKKRGVATGYEDGTFKPSRMLSRAELLKLIVRAKNAYPYSLEYSRCFVDVKTEWFASSVCYAQSKGWIQGYEDHTFRPSQNIISSEARKMVFRSFDVSEDDVALMKDLPEDSSRELTRAESALLLAQVLSVKNPF